MKKQCRPTQRALDWWEFAASKSIFNAWAFFGTISLVHAHPPASNANRWAAEQSAVISYRRKELEWNCLFKY